VEPRTTTGYSTSHRRLCDDCQELQTEEYQVDRERAAGDRQRAVAFDAVLMRKKNPLSLPEFTAHLEMLARYWLDQNIYQACLRDPDRGHGMGLFADILGAYPVGGGCMVCGATPVRMFWTRDNELPEDYPLSFTCQRVGITLFHVDRVCISDLVIQGFQLDGVNAYNSVRDLMLERVTCRGNGRSGLAVGAASLVHLGSSLVGNNGEAQVLALPMAELHVRDTQLLSNTAPGLVNQGARAYLDGKPIPDGIDQRSAKP